MSLKMKTDKSNEYTGLTTHTHSDVIKYWEYILEPFSQNMVNGRALTCPLYNFNLHFYLKNSVAK